MVQRILFFIVILLLGGSMAVADVLHGQCSIRFFGDSTLHGFEGTANCQPFSLTSESQESGGQIIRQPLVTVRIDSMDTDNDRRDKKMREMFASEKFPIIKARFDDLDPDQVLKRLSANGKEPGQLEFDLEIRDQVRLVKAEVHNLNVTPETITFTLNFSVSLENFGLEAPGVLGLIRVADRVDLEVDAVLQRQPPAKKDQN